MWVELFQFIIKNGGFGLHHAECHGFRLMNSCLSKIIIFESVFTTFKLNILFRGSWGSSVDWLEPKNDPTIGNLACPNLWNAVKFQHSYTVCQRLWPSLPSLWIRARTLTCVKIPGTWNTLVWYGYVTMFPVLSNKKMNVHFQCK